MKISIYAPYAKERFETARQRSILHPERIVGNSQVTRLLTSSSGGQFFASKRLTLQVVC
jgi:hypothetical protein